MKKKLLFLSIFAVLTVLFAVGISASPYIYDFGEVEKIDFFENDENYINTVIGSTYVKPTSKDARCVVSCTCEKGRHTYPTYYIMQEKKSDWLDLFRKDFVNLNANNPCGANYTKDNLLAIEVPEGIADFWGQQNTAGAFMNHTSLVYVSLPSTMEDLHQNPFRGCTSLEWVDFSKTTKIKTLYNSSFNGCTSLKGVCLPDSITTMQSATFIGCVNLGPVYLPEKLISFGTDTQWNTFIGGQNGSGAKSTKLFLTNEKFNNPDEVVKPKVYYMPSGFKSCGDQLFRGCSNINDVIVFPTTYTAVGDSRSFLDYGATAENPKTIVFLGDMTSFSAYADSTSSYMNYVFANANDTVDGFTYTFTSSGASDVTIYSCASQKVCTPTSDSWTSQGFAHFANPKTFEAVTPSTCTENQTVSASCFCGASMGTIEIENTALGHSYTVDVGLIYENYMNNGYYCMQCERCDDVTKGEKADALFICLGYSAPEYGAVGIVVGYSVNNTALSEYERVTKKTLNYGVFAVAQEKLGENDIFGSDGEAASGVIFAEITSYDFAAFELKIAGFTDAQKDKDIVMGAYVAVTDENGTAYSYMQVETKGEFNGKYYFVSYNDVVGAK